MNPPPRQSSPPVAGAPLANPLAPETPAATAARTILLGQLKAIVSQEEGVRSGADPEALHDFRVAVRRTRAGLAEFKGLLPAARRRFRAEFAWLARQTGRARDLDVHLIELNRDRRLLPPERAELIEPLVRFVAERRRREQDPLVALLASPRYRRLIADWRVWLEKPRGAGKGEKSQPVLEWARPRLAKALGRVLRRGEEVGAPPADDQLHALRIAGKKARYLLEFFRPLLPPRPTAALIGKFKKLQDLLGGHQDLTVQITLLGDLADDPDLAATTDPAFRAALEELTALLAGEKARVRKRFAGFFRRFSQPRTLALIEQVLGCPLAAPPSQGTAAVSVNPTRRPGAEHSRDKDGPMKQLTLLRHAKSSRKDPSLDDFHRPLTRRGMEDARRMGAWLRGQGLAADLALTSPAVRAMATAETVFAVGEGPAAPLQVRDEIYEADRDTLLHLVRGLDDGHSHVVLIGHNPGLTDLWNFLSSTGTEKIPTCAVFSLALEVNAWAEAGEGCGQPALIGLPRKIAEAVEAKEKKMGKKEDKEKKAKKKEEKDKGKRKCLKGKSEAKAEPGKLKCEKCGAVSRVENHLCKPKKIKGKK